MASLDVLDYLTGLDAALAPRLPAALRRSALRDARRVVDMLAFRFAILDERAMPEDLDYLRAIEAMKPADRAAEVLARRRPLYARKRRRRLATTWTVLAVLAAAAGGLAWLATSETAQTLTYVNEHPFSDVTYSVNRTFVVEPAVNRLHVSGDVFVRGSDGNVDVFLKDPHNVTVLHETFNAASGNYLRENILSPTPGVWTLWVDYNQAHGSVAVTVDGVRSAR